MSRSIQRRSWAEVVPVLGLAVVWNVVQDHKGYIGVKSNKNGTMFEVFFPITREEISGKKLSMPFKDLKGDGEKILVDSRATGGNFCGVSEPDMASSPIQGINGKLIAKRYYNKCRNRDMGV